MEKKQIIAMTTLLISFFWVIIGLIYLNSIIDKYENDVCKNVDWGNIRGYNGTTLGGYSCFIKGDRIDVYFTPTEIDNVTNHYCIGCSKEEYHFVCFNDKPGYCFLEDKFLKVGI